ncbi:hypothetical protein B0T10DRAFT_458209 [Thelonectria olida]|uniref:Uncharacterized protein n=1 Tax=Thelonectria olida TaxID=1576542 RepID=A0A9P9AUD3_9HYPO|nr:hypothetical protein B0T10DRAFT_458209 [Thelonectria olida]
MSFTQGTLHKHCGITTQERAHNLATLDRASQHSCYSKLCLRKRLLGTHFKFAINWLPMGCGHSAEEWGTLKMCSIELAIGLLPSAGRQNQMTMDCSCAHHLLNRRYLHSCEEDVLAGVEIWYHAIQRPEEREAFLLLANRLWPDAAKRFPEDSPDIGENGTQIRTGFCKGQWSANRPVNPESSGQPVSSQQFAFASISTLTPFPPTHAYQSAQHPAYDIYTSRTSAWPDPNITPTQALQGEVFQSMSGTNNLWEFASLDSGHTYSNEYENPPTLSAGRHANPLVPTDVSWLDVLDPNTLAHTCNATTDSTRTKVKISAEDLRKAKLFTNFFEFLWHLHDLTFALSGNRLTVQDLESLLTYLQERNSDRDHTIEDFMKIVLAESNSGGLVCQAVTSMTERFVKLGYLQSVELVTTYM